MWQLYGELLVLVLVFFGLGCVIGRGLAWLVVRRSAAAEAARAR